MSMPVCTTLPRCESRPRAVHPVSPNSVPVPMLADWIPARHSETNTDRIVAVVVLLFGRPQHYTAGPVLPEFLLSDPHEPVSFLCTLGAIGNPRFLGDNTFLRPTK